MTEKKETKQTFHKKPRMEERVNSSVFVSVNISTNNILHIHMIKSEDYFGLE